MNGRARKDRDDARHLRGKQARAFASILATELAFTGYQERVYLNTNRAMASLCFGLASLLKSQNKKVERARTKTKSNQI